MHERRGEMPVGRKIGFTNRTVWAEYGPMRIQTVVSSCAAEIRNLNESGWLALRGGCWRTRSDGSTELG
jgi:hypothetical protein